MPIIEGAAHAFSQGMDGRIDVFRERQSLDHPLAIFRRVAELTGLDKGGDQSQVLLRALLGELPADEEHLLRMTRGDFSARGDAPPCTPHDGDGIPWLTDAVAIEIAGHEV